MRNALFFGLAMIYAFSAEAQTSRLPLTASNFLQPLRASFKRNPEWPERLTFAYNKISEDEFRERLRTPTWRVLCECDGQPVSSEYLHSHDLLDGYLRAGIEYSFSETLAYGRTFRYPDAKPEKDDILDDITAPYRVISNSEEWYTLRFERSLNAKEQLNNAEVQPVQVNETGELVFQIFNNHQGKQELCPNGHKMHFIMVPVSDDVM